jgi:hypothetical protein
MTRLDTLEPLRINLRQKSWTDYTNSLLGANVALNEYLSSVMNLLGKRDPTCQIQEVLKKIATNSDYNPDITLNQY